MEQVHGIWGMTLLGMLGILEFLVLIIVYYLELDNCKNNFLGLDEDPSYSINGSFGLSEKKFSINFS